MNFRFRSTVSFLFFFLFFYFLQFYCPNGVLSWENCVSFSGQSQLRQSRATQPTVHAKCFSVSIIHRTLAWTTWFLTCTQMLMHAIAHGGVRTPWESLHWKLTLGEKSLAAQRNRTCVGSVPVRCSTNWATSPSLFDLSNICFRVNSILGSCLLVWLKFRHDLKHFW